MELSDFLKDNNLSAKVKFIDIFRTSEEELGAYQNGLSLLDEGKATLPLIYINGKPVFYGGIDNTAILNFIREAKNE